MPEERSPGGRVASNLRKRAQLTADDRYFIVTMMKLLSKTMRLCIQTDGMSLKNDELCSARGFPTVADNRAPPKVPDNPAATIPQDDF